MPVLLALGLSPWTQLCLVFLMQSCVGSQAPPVPVPQSQAVCPQPGSLEGVNFPVKDLGVKG